MIASDVPLKNLRKLSERVRPPLTVLVQGDHAMPITAGLKTLSGIWVAQWHLVAAGSLVAALPPVLIFFLRQRYFIAGLTMGATKG